MKVWLALCHCALCLGAAGAVFWAEDIRYSIPTPEPPGWVPGPGPGESPAWPASAGWRPDSRDEKAGHMLHFVNPECPCSRFKLKHIHELIREFGRDVTMTVILEIGEGSNGEKALERFTREFQVRHPAVDGRTAVEVRVDKDARLARACGVYATPQAVILDRAGRVYFRGNYSSARYCVDPAREYARASLNRMLTRSSAAPKGGRVDPAAYGCAIETFQAPAKPAASMDHES